MPCVRLPVQEVTYLPGLQACIGPRRRCGNWQATLPPKPHLVVLFLPPPAVKLLESRASILRSLLPLMVLINSVLSTIVYDTASHLPNAPPQWSISGGTVVGLLRNGLKKQAALQDRLCRPTVLTRRQPVKLERPPQSTQPLSQFSSHSLDRSPLFLGFLVSTFTSPYI